MDPPEPTPPSQPKTPRIGTLNLIVATAAGGFTSVSRSISTAGGALPTTTPICAAMRFAHRATAETADAATADVMVDSVRL